VAGLAVRTDLLGVTSVVRALELKASFYDRLLDLFHSEAVTRSTLGALGAGRAQAISQSATAQRPLGSRRRWHQSRQTWQEDARGQAVASAIGVEHQTRVHYGALVAGGRLLVHAATSVFAVPLAMRIHEGLVWSNRDRRTLLDKMLALLGIVDIGQAFYFVADAYYASGKIISGLLDQGNT
jgi:hypothetical protein